MQNNINNNERDAFSEIFRKKLENHRIPVDADSWDAIQARMKATKRKKIIPLWWWYSGGAAVAVVILLFTLLPFSNQSPEHPIAKQLIIHKTVILKRHATIAENNSSVMVKATSNNFSKASVNNSNQNTVSIAVTEIKEKPANKTGIALVQKESVAGEPVAGSVEPKETGKNKPDEKQIVHVDAQNQDWTDPLKKEGRNDWVLIAGIGSGSGSSVKNDGLGSYLGDVRSSIVRAPTMNTSILSPADFSDRTYTAPISFGFTASKKLSKILSLETGLTYTYLLTKFESMNYNADLNLHYLGIPMNLSAQIWKNQKWGVYGSGGAMVEKGLRSVYVQNQHVGNQIITTTASTKIEGLQWSLNAALGVTYNIYKDIDIYLEPKFSYYFDNNQPISIRTDREIIVGVEGGFRYNF